MAYPKRLLTGNIYTSGGDIVTAGKITKYLIPAGATVLDTGGVDWLKVGSREGGVITASGVQSLYVTVMDSTLPEDMYYKVKIETYEPVQDVWYEIWRILDLSAIGVPLPIGDIVPTQYGPYLPHPGYAPVVFSEGIGAQGPAGAPGLSKPTRVNSLPTIISSMEGALYVHDRLANAQGDSYWVVAKTDTGSLVYVPWFEI